MQDSEITVLDALQVLERTFHYELPMYDMEFFAIAAPKIGRAHNGEDLT